MRSHPVVGTTFLLLAAAFFAIGAFAKDAPGPFERLPVPPEVAVLFITWQLAVWCALFGVFFLRPRGGLPMRRRAPARW